MNISESCDRSLVISVIHLFFPKTLMSVVLQASIYQQHPVLPTASHYCSLKRLQSLHRNVIPKTHASITLTKDAVKPLSSFAVPVGRFAQTKILQKIKPREVGLTVVHSIMSVQQPVISTSSTHRAAM